MLNKFSTYFGLLYQAAYRLSQLLPNTLYMGTSASREKSNIYIAIVSKQLKYEHADPNRYLLKTHKFIS